MALFDRILHPSLQGVLQRLNKSVPCQPEASHNAGDWTWIKASGVPNSLLFRKIERDWTWIVGPEHQSFALIYVEHGRDAGVWLHHLKTAVDRSEYAPGVHQIPSW